MEIVSLPSGNYTTFQNLYTLSGYTVGSSLIVTNNASHSVYLSQSTLAPTSRLQAYPVVPGGTVVVHGNEDALWINGDGGDVIVQLVSGTISPFSSVDLPHDVYTWDEDGYRRLRVDTGQTSFFIGRQARTFYEFSIATGATYIIQANVPVNTVLWNVSLTVDAGSIELSTYVGGTPSVTLADPIPVIPKNTMSTRPTPVYVPQNTLVGGLATLTGGTRIDVARVVTSGATSQQITVGSSPFSERGVGIGTYYWVFNNFSNGTATGVFSAYWEERDI